uniref:Uncharacterized protein n=1 Tax=Candidatus Kentrum sp. TC TaxID=2126339 RepID=A0A450YAY3_9GAMM|nr:MAG: hypothetical protein BECKTC1821D_GA0114238_100543 [Candidatus Kentron sp. TC]
MSAIVKEAYDAFVEAGVSEENPRWPPKRLPMTTPASPASKRTS